jgi:hypothetical protein
MHSVGPKNTVCANDFAPSQGHSTFLRIGGNNCRSKVQYRGRAFAFARRQSLEFLVQIAPMAEKSLL